MLNFLKCQNGVFEVHFQGTDRGFNAQAEPLSVPRLNSSKAGGPDGIPNWILKDYAELLAFPILKVANVSPLPKIKPATELRKDLRPISLTTRLSKIAEELSMIQQTRRS